MLKSERMVVQSPMSFGGSRKRLWNITRSGPGWFKVVTIPTAVFLIFCGWVVVACWYVALIVVTVLGGWIMLVIFFPFRLLRRGSRKRKVEAQQHRETLEAIHRQR